MKPKIKEQTDQMEPWFRLVTPIRGIKGGGDGWIINGRSEILYNPLRDLNINISAPLLYQNRKIDIFSGAYVGTGEMVYPFGNNRTALIDKGLYFDRGDIQGFQDQMIEEMFKNFYFGKNKQKLNGPFKNSEATHRIRYHSNEDCNFYFSVFNGLQEDVYLLPTKEEHQWKYPHFIVFPSRSRDNLRFLSGRKEDVESKSLSEILIQSGKLDDFFNRANPQKLTEREGSTDLVRDLRER